MSVPLLRRASQASFTRMTVPVRSSTATRAEREARTAPLRASMLRSDRSLFRRRRALANTPATSWSCSNVSAGQCRSRRRIISARNPMALAPQE